MNIKESDKLYLTSNLFYVNNKLYNYDNDKKLNIKVNTKNWHKYLSDYGWSKLEWGWKRRIQTHSKNNSNFRYGILDCGSNGDCLFHVIAEALNSVNLLECPYDVTTLRKIASECITDDNFVIILETYKLELENLEFIGDWDPDSIESLTDLGDELCKCGNNFWGDHIILQLLQQKLEFNVIILNSENLDENMESYSNLSIAEKFKIHPMASDFNKFKHTIVIYYIDGLHFQLVGYFDGTKMVTLFNTNNIPEELIEIYNIDCHNSL